MTVDTSTLFGIALGLVGVINAWMLFGQANLRGDMTKLRDADSSLALQIGAIREMVAGQYITRAEFNAALDRQTATILAAMNRIAAHTAETTKE
jgi:hypothetical protein